VRGRRRWVAGLLTGGFVLAVATPSYLSYSRPSVAGYLLHRSTCSKLCPTGSPRPSGCRGGAGEAMRRPRSSPLFFLRRP
jgi:hypothetical protein